GWRGEGRVGGGRGWVRGGGGGGPAAAPPPAAAEARRRRRGEEEIRGRGRCARRRRAAVQAANGGVPAQLHRIPGRAQQLQRRAVARGDKPRARGCTQEREDRSRHRARGEQLLPRLEGGP